MTIHLSQRFPLAVTLPWLAVMLLSVAIRYLVGRHYLRLDPARQTAADRAWRLRFGTGALATAVLWSVAACLFFEGEASLQLCFLIAILAGVGAGATQTLSPSPRIAHAFLIVLLAPFGVRFLLLGHLEAVLIGAIVFVFLLFLCLQVGRHYAVLRESLELNHENALIVADLSKAKEAAEQANRERADFMATLSHELRTPVSGILGLTHAMQKGSLSDDQAHHLSSIADSAELLLTLLNDFLDFSKIEAGKLSIETISFDLAEITAQCASVARALAQRKNLHLTYENEVARTTRVKGDPVRLRQILLNLLSNAVKFTSEGYIRFRIEQVSARDGALLLRFSVEDTGIGMTPEVQERIFQRFSQAAPSTSREFGGTGLGLAITRDLVHLMGGTLQLESTAGEGSTFAVEVSLPAAAEPTAEPLEEEPMDPAELTGRVLIVEDDPVNRRVLQLLLESTRFEILTASDGDSAIEKFVEGNLDLVLMDFQLPGMDGIELTRWIRAGNFARLRADVPIVATTANATAEAEAACHDVGMNAFLTKPLRRDPLLRTLARLLRRHRQKQKEA